MSRISINAVKKDFMSTHILKSVSLDVRDQEFCVLLGPSGCGKTTLLRILAGLETESAGELMIGDRRVNGLSPGKRKIAMVFQNYAVFPHMTIGQNIGFGLKMAKESAANIDVQVQRAAKLMHIEHLLGRYAGQLSGGQRQRVAVARALAMSPDVLLMDEPLSNLDALLRLEMRTELKALLQETKTTTIYVTHDQVEAMSLADRIAVMHAGEIVQFASPMEVYEYPKTAFVGSFIGNPPMNFMPVDVAVSLSSTAAPAQAVRAGIRPEYFIPGQSQVSVKVRVVEALGEKQQINGELGGEKIRLSLPNHHRICAGDLLPVSVAPEHVRWYDAQDQLLATPATHH
ncbi:ABC transporter ATP-binding protein [Rhodoferax sp.]|uniref:ABC transporter ATP-binding protein n=1 Tax=Rhodoferax sp. TaxID=50421 RepID=UPI0025DE0440|nr:ABC transporter ATP-binding protein [Rhodoferax sp.]